LTAAVVTVGRSEVRLAVRVQPRAARGHVVGRHGDALKVQVAAPPVDGAANAALIVVLAAWLGLPRRDLRLVHGARGRDKVVAITTADPAALGVRIAQLVEGCVDSSEAPD
jgi:uncharacterized protein